MNLSNDSSRSVFPRLVASGGSIYAVWSDVRGDGTSIRYRTLAGGAWSTTAEIPASEPIHLLDARAGDAGDVFLLWESPAGNGSRLVLCRVLGPVMTDSSEVFHDDKDSRRMGRRTGCRISHRRSVQGVQVVSRSSRKHPSCVCRRPGHVPVQYSFLCQLEWGGLE